MPIVFACMLKKLNLFIIVFNTDLKLHQSGRFIEVTAFNLTSVNIVFVKTSKKLFKTLNQMPGAFY
jgi:hypothetical protein